MTALTPSTAPARGVHPRLSMSALSSVRWSFDQDVALWRELGVQWAGLMGTKLGDDPEGRLGVLADAGIKVSTVVGPRFDLAKPDSWAQTQADLCRIVDAVASFDGWSVYITPGRSTGALWEDLLETLATAIAPCVDHAGERGVRLGFEPSRRTEVSFVNSLEDAIIVAERTGLGIVADIGNFWMERRLRELLLRAAEHLCLVQLTDVEIGTLGTAADPPSGGRTPLGEGNLAIPRMLRDIKDTGYDGPLELEIIGPLSEREGYESVIRRALAGAEPLLHQAGL